MMAAKPLLPDNNQTAPVVSPGFFDGQIDPPRVQLPTAPGDEPPPPAEEFKVAGWGKAFKAIKDARKKIKEHKATDPDAPLQRQTPAPSPADANVVPGTPEITPGTVAPDSAAAPGSALDPDAPTVQAPDGDTAARVPVDADAIAEVAEKYTRFTTDTPFVALKDFNAANLNTEQDVLAVIAAHSEVYAKQIGEATGGVVPQAMTRQMADFVGASEGRLMNKLLGGKILHGTKPGENAANMLAARDLLIASAGESDRLAKLVASGDARAIADAGFESAEAAAVAMERQFALNAAIHAQVKGAQTEIARTLASFNVPAQGNALRQKAIGDVLASAGSNATAQERAAMYLAIEDPVQAAKFTRLSVGKKMFNAVYEVWINALLSSPVSHMANFVGNLAFGAGQIPTRTMAGLMGHMRRSGILSGPREGGVILGEDVASAMGYVYAMADAVKMSGKTFIDPTGDIMAKVEPGKKFRQNAASAEAFEASGMLGHAIDLAGSLSTLGRFSTRGLAAGDVLFKVMAQRASLYADAFAAASKEGITDAADFADAVAHHIENPSKAMQERAVDFGRFSTFTDELGEFGRNVQGVAANRFIRWFIPFLRTPANIISRAWDHTPFKLFTDDYKKAIAQGGEASDMARARVALGSATSVAVAGLAASGYITGGGPSDPKLRANLVRQKWQPYSVKIGDEFISFKRLEPYGTVLGLVADLYDIASGQVDHADVAEASAAIAMAFSKNVTSKTYMEGLSNLIDAIEHPDRYGPKAIEALIKTIVVPRGVAQFEKILDPEKRYVRGLVDAIRQDVPGFSDKLPADLNLWGEPIVYQIGGLVTGMLNPFYASTWTPNPVDDELDRLQMGFSPPPETIPNSGGRLLFDPWEYHDFAERAGKTAKAAITALITGKRSGVEGFDEDQKALVSQLIEDKTFKEYGKRNDLLKEAMIRQIWDGAKIEAWQWMLTKSKYADAMEELMEELQRDKIKEIQQ
jgi:hypothetical protein